MSLLLDTHVFIWMLTNPDKIEEKTKTVIEKEPCFLSSVSVFEIIQKVHIGKLKIFINYDELIQDNILKLLPLQYDHVIRLRDVPLIHRDPFDRMLIAQSMVEDIPLVTGDKAIHQYPVDFIKP